MNNDTGDPLSLPDHQLNVSLAKLSPIGKSPHGTKTVYDFPRGSRKFSEASSTPSSNKSQMEFVDELNFKRSNNRGAGKDQRVETLKKQATTPFSPSNKMASAGWLQQQPNESDVSQVFNSITDVNNKELVQLAIKRVSNPKQRAEIIDKVISRKNEIKNAEQIMQIARCAPLVQRFMNKACRTLESNAAYTPRDLRTTSPATSRQSQFFTPKNDDSAAASATDSPNVSTPMATNLNTPRSFSSGVSQFLKSGSHVISKGIAFSLFYKPKPLSNQLDLLSYGGGKMINPTPDESEAPPQQRRMLSHVSLDHQISRTKQGNSSNQNSNPLSLEGWFQKVNLQSVSQNSLAMEERGKHLWRHHANALLKDFQKINLAQHFKSKSLNVQAFKNSTINTFNFKNLLHPKNPKAKVNSVDGNHAEAREKLFKKFRQYENPEEVIQVVSNDISTFLTNNDGGKQSYEVIDGFFSPKKQLQFSEFKQLEANANKEVQEKQRGSFFTQSVANLNINGLSSSNTIIAESKSRKQPYLNHSNSPMKKISVFTDNYSIPEQMIAEVQQNSSSSATTAKSNELDKDQKLNRAEKHHSTHLKSQQSLPNSVSSSSKRGSLKDIEFNSPSAMFSKSPTSHFSFKNPSTNKPYRIGQSSTTNNHQQKLIVHQPSSLNDIAHKSDAMDLNSSLVSITEVKLDHLYRESQKLQKNISLQDQKQIRPTTKEKKVKQQTIDDLASAQSQIQDTFFKKIKSEIKKQQKFGYR